MPAKVTADYSQFPESIRTVMPYLEGEVMQLRTLWGLFENLFVGNQARQQHFRERLGPLLIVFRQLMQNELVLSIARLTDRKEHGGQENLTLQSLMPAVDSAQAPEFGSRVTDALEAIKGSVKNIRKHRDKLIAHFDLATSLDPSSLPKVFVKDVRPILERMEAFLNLFNVEFRKVPIEFDNLSSDPIVGSAQLTVHKAMAYDILQRQRKIPLGEVERIIESQERQGS